MPTTTLLSRFTIVSLTLSLAWVGPALALTPEETCVVDKLHADKERAICLANEQIEEVKGKTPDFEQCAAEFDKAIAKADEKAAKEGAACQLLVSTGECPDGQVRAPGTEGFCIDQGVRPADTYVNAARACTLEGGHLCEASQWIGACTSATELGISDMPVEFEWIGTIGGVADNVLKTAGAWRMGGGPSGCASFNTSGSANILTATYPYRCCSF